MENVNHVNYFKKKEEVKEIIEEKPIVKEEAVKEVKKKKSLFIKKK